MIVSIIHMEVSDLAIHILWNVFSQTTTVGLKPVALPERANMALHTTTWVTSESNQGSGESDPTQVDSITIMHKTGLCTRFK